MFHPELYINNISLDVSFPLKTNILKFFNEEIDGEFDDLWTLLDIINTHCKKNGKPYFTEKEIALINNELIEAYANAKTYKTPD